MKRIPGMLATASLTALLASGCTMPWTTTVPTAKAQKIPPQTYPSMSADDERGAAGAALWVRGWADRKGTLEQQRITQTVELVGGSWQNKGDLALIVADVTSQDQASQLVDIFNAARAEAARAESHAYQGTVAVAVYNKQGTMLSYRQ